MSARAEFGTCSVLLWASSGLPAPKFTAGTPRIEKRATSVQTS